MPSGLAPAVTVFTAIFVLEVPDKTALATLLLGTRHRPLPVFGGAALAFLVQSVVAVFAGSLLSLLPREPIRVAAGVLFVVMAAVLVRRGLRQMEAEGAKALAEQQRRHRRPFVTAFLVVFAAEWGDLTQLATATLQARYRQPLLVFTSATLALWTVAALAVIAGNRLGATVPERPLLLGAASVTAILGILLIAGVVG